MLNMPPLAVYSIGATEFRITSVKVVVVVLIIVFALWQPADKKITIDTLQKLVALMLIDTAPGLGAGIIST